MDKNCIQTILFCVGVSMLIVLFAIGCVAIIISVSDELSTPPVESLMYYARTGEITEVDSPGNILTIACDNGYTYFYVPATGTWTPGDLCTMVMFDTGTPDPSDDQILNIWYFGRIRMYGREED